MKYISHTDYTEMLNNFGKNTPKEVLKETIEEYSVNDEYPESWKMREADGVEEGIFSDLSNKINARIAGADPKAYKECKAEGKSINRLTTYNGVRMNEMEACIRAKGAEFTGQTYKGAPGFVGSGADATVAEGFGDTADEKKVEDAIQSGKIKPEEVKAAAEKAMKGDSSDLAALMAFGIKLAEDLSSKQKKIASAAPPSDKITGADFAALKASKKEGLNLPGQDNLQATGPTIQTVEGAPFGFSAANLSVDERKQLKEFIESMRTIKEEIKKLVSKGKSGAKVESDMGGPRTNLVMTTNTMSEDGEEE